MVAPEVQVLHRHLRNGRLRWPAKRLLAPEWPVQVPELTRFLKTCSLDDLAAALRRAPLLLAHPFVWWEFRYLRAVGRNAAMLSDQLRSTLDDREAEAAARTELTKLITAWTEGMLPGRLVKIERPKRRGRPSRFRPKDIDEPWYEMADFLHDCGQWVQALSNREEFTWRIFPLASVPSSRFKSAWREKRLGVRSEEVSDGFGQKVLIWTLPGVSPKSQIPVGTGIGTVPVPNPKPDGTGRAAFGALFRA
jgi:hypothetical protein